MMKYIFASHNQHKLKEIKIVASPYVDIISLSDLNHIEEVDETGSTLRENALIKAQAIYNRYQHPTFADDSGLEVQALDNEPGVYSKRFAGLHATDADNRQKLLTLMKEQTNRRARFVTVIVLIQAQQVYYFEGEVKGEILQYEIGSNGFGYDSIFKPLGYNISMAQMSIAEKNKISHRSHALQQMMVHIKQHF